jgi:glycosyltransferase involved in cell wall biosynthesis
MYNNISVTILTKNSQKYLDECLSALSDFNEIILLDNGSSDKTLEIAKKYSNVIIHKHEFIGFGPLKRLAVSYTKNSWVLSVDSDEIFSRELVDEILSLQLDENYVYAIERDNYYNKKLIKCCGWDNDIVDRLFNKNSVNFNTKQVHESLVITNNISVKKLKNKFKHYTFDSSSELLLKMDKYANLYAIEHKNQKKSSPLKAFSSGLFAFFKNYILQKGFLFGYEGLLISISNANGAFYKYIKLYEENKA